MSLDATRWAWKQDVRPMAKLVLLSLADRAGEQHEAWPTVARIEHDTGMDRKTIMAWTKFLEEQGLISVERVPGIGNVYRLIGVSDRHTENDRPVPKTGQVKNGTSPKNGTPTSPKNGTPTSPKNGTQNLSIEPTKESTNTHSDFSESAEFKKPVGELSPAEVCVLWVSLGVFPCNPSHPDLLGLVAEDVSVAEWEFAGLTARDLGKGFGYALGIVRSRLQERRRNGGILASGVNRGNSSGFGGNSRREHSRRLGEHLDSLIVAEFGQGLDVGVV